MSSENRKEPAPPTEKEESSSKSVKPSKDGLNFKRPAPINRSKRSNSLSDGTSNGNRIVIYDSKSKTLQLAIRGYVLGTVATGIKAEIKLDQMTEAERQRVIAIAKLISSFVNGHDVTISRKVVKDEVELITLSHIDQCVAFIEKSLKHSNQQNGPISIAVHSDTPL